VAAFRDLAVYLGFAEETAQSRESRNAALLQTSSVRLLVSALLGALAAGAIIGLARCLLDGKGVTLAGIIEKGWLLAAVVLAAGVTRDLWDRRCAVRGDRQAKRP
jgi:predicted lipid-binding transport protein (Tim44 family)